MLRPLRLLPFFPIQYRLCGCIALAMALALAVAMGTFAAPGAEKSKPKAASKEKQKGKPAASQRQAATGPVHGPMPPPRGDGAGADSVTDSSPSGAPASASPSPAPSAPPSGQKYASPDQYPTPERITGNDAGNPAASTTTETSDSTTGPAPAPAPTKVKQYATPDQYPTEERIPNNNNAGGSSGEASPASASRDHDQGSAPAPSASPSPAPASTPGFVPGAAPVNESGDAPAQPKDGNTTTTTNAKGNVVTTTTTSVNGTTTTTTTTSNAAAQLLDAPHKRELSKKPDDVMDVIDNIAIANRKPILRVEIHPMPTPLPEDAHYSMGIRVLFRNAPALQIATEPERGRYAPWLIHVSRFVTEDRAIIMGWSASGAGYCTLHALAVQITSSGRTLTPTDYLRVEYAQPSGGMLLSEKDGICLVGVELPTDDTQLDGSRYFLDSAGTLLSYADLPLADTSTCTPEDGPFTHIDNLAYMTAGTRRTAKVIWLDFSTGKFRTINSPSQAMTQKQAVASLQRRVAGANAPGYSRSTPTGKLPSLYKRELSPAEQLAEHRRIQQEIMEKNHPELRQQRPRPVAKPTTEKPVDETIVRQKGPSIVSPDDITTTPTSPDFNARSPRGRATGDAFPFGGGAGGVP